MFYIKVSSYADIPMLDVFDTCKSAWILEELKVQVHSSSVPYCRSGDTNTTLHLPTASPETGELLHSVKY